MWSNEELEKLADTITMVDINKICSKEELEIIKMNVKICKKQIRLPTFFAF